MYFGQIFVKNGRILVRFSGKIGQIVSQIFECFSQILIASTLSDGLKKEASGLKIQMFLSSWIFIENMCIISTWLFFAI